MMDMEKDKNLEEEQESLEEVLDQVNGGVSNSKEGKRENIMLPVVDITGRGKK